MIDFHSHILPNIDDGSNSIEETINMLKEANNAGFEKIIATSHYMEGHYEIDESKRNLWKDELNVILKEKNIDTEIVLGNEIYITHNIMRLIETKKASPIGKKHILIELPLIQQLIGIENILYDIQANGFTPIIAHPERYKIVKENPNIVYNWIEQGALIQSNFGSIIGQYGKEAKDTVEVLLKHNMVHFLGSDVHSSKSVYFKIPEIMKKLNTIINTKKIEELTYTNAKTVLNNNTIEINMPTKAKKTIWGNYI